MKSMREPLVCKEVVISHAKKNQLAIVLGVLWVSCMRALAQNTVEPTDAEQTKLIVNYTSIAWTTGSLLFGYIISVVISAFCSHWGYPPNIARLGCWMGFTISIVFIAFVVFGHILLISLPPWLLVLILVVIGLFGVGLYATRKHNAH